MMQKILDAIGQQRKIRGLDKKPLQEYLSYYNPPANYLLYLESMAATPPKVIVKDNEAILTFKRVWQQDRMMMRKGIWKSLFDYAEEDPKEYLLIALQKRVEDNGHYFLHVPTNEVREVYHSGFIADISPSLEKFLFGTEFPSLL